MTNRRRLGAACIRCAEKKVKCKESRYLDTCQRCLADDAACQWPAGDANAPRVQNLHACEGCRVARVRCMPSADGQTADCVRCVRKGRACVPGDGSVDSVDNLKTRDGNVIAGPPAMRRSSTGGSSSSNRAASIASQDHEMGRLQGERYGWLPYQPTSYERVNGGPPHAGPSTYHHRQQLQGPNRCSPPQQAAGPSAPGSSSGHRSTPPYPGATQGRVQASHPAASATAPNAGAPINAAASSRPNSPNRSWWEIIMSASPDTEPVPDSDDSVSEFGPDP